VARETLTLADVVGERKGGERETVPKNASLLDCLLPCNSKTETQRLMGHRAITALIQQHRQIEWLFLLRAVIKFQREVQNTEGKTPAFLEHATEINIDGGASGAAS
jgi:hypothetical protein